MRGIIPTALAVPTLGVVEEPGMLPTQRPRLIERGHPRVINAAVVAPLHLPPVDGATGGHDLARIIMGEVQGEGGVLRVKVTLLDVGQPWRSLLLLNERGPVDIRAPGMLLYLVN